MKSTLAKLVVSVDFFMPIFEAQNSNFYNVTKNLIDFSAVRNIILRNISNL